jgi:type VI secretion system secreted protein Hcp
MASDYLLEIDGIKGESEDKGHPGTIEVQHFSWGASNGGTFAHGGGGGAGKVSLDDLSITTHVGTASPNLFLSCATGKHIKKAVLYVRKAGGKQEDYYKVTLEDLLVSSYSSSGVEGGDSRPIDTFGLNAARWKLEVAPQKADGSIGTHVPGGWDQKLNVKL